MTKVSYANASSWVSKLTVTLGLLLCLFSFGATQAMAADTWLPDFDPNVHVYNDPALSGRVHFSDDFAGQVEAAASAHHLSVYVVNTQQGSELSGDRSSWASNMMHNRLWDRWRYSSGFSDDRILVILYIRAQGSDVGSIALRSGTYLHGLNIDADLFSSSSGPVMPTARQFMSTDPQTGEITIINNINSSIDQGGVAKASGYWFGWSGTTWLIIIIVVVILLVLLLAAAGGGGGGGGGFWFISTCSSGSSSGGSSSSSCSSSSCGGGGGV